MVIAGEEDDRVACVAHGAQARVVVQAGQHGDVGDVLLQVRQHLGRVAHADRDIDARVTLAVAVHHLDHMEGPHGAQLELAAVEPSGVPQQVVRLQLQGGQALGDGQ
ncbi:hypothetical protein D3C84_963060 [compost metagenome]